MPHYFIFGSGAGNIAVENIACVITYDIPEYALQDGKKPLDKLCYIDQFNEYPIKLMSKDSALQFIQQMYPKLSCHVANMIISKVGTRFYNLSQVIMIRWLDYEWIIRK